MNPVRLSSLALTAFGSTEAFMRKGQAAKSLQRTAANKGTPLIFGCYALIAALFFLPSRPLLVVAASSIHRWNLSVRRIIVNGQ